MENYEYVASNFRLARFPIHWLSSVPVLSRGPTIEMLENYGSWYVSYGRPPKPPGALGMRVDKLVVNPALLAHSMSGRKGGLIRLGSLRSIAREIGAGQGNTTDLAEALRRNAAVRVQVSPGGLGWQTRYDVYLPGDRLPGRKAADEVHIRPSDFYRDWVGGAEWSIRLRRDLLRDLPASSARLYEILASLRRRFTATVLYSDICRYMPVRRGTVLESSPARLERLHEPLKAHGLIERVAFEPIEYMSTLMLPQAYEWVSPAPQEGSYSPPFYLVGDRLHRDWEVHYVYGKEAESAFRADGHAIEVGSDAAWRLRLTTPPAD